MTRFARDDANNSAAASTAIAYPSPDGSRVVTVVRRGNIENNTNDYSLLEWPSRPATLPAPPSVIITMPSSSNRPGIEAVTWLADSETILFLGERAGQTHQLYRLNVRTRTLSRITSLSTNVLAYSINPGAKRLALTAALPTSSFFSPHEERHGLVVEPTAFLYNLLIDQKELGESGVGIGDIGVFVGALSEESPLDEESLVQVATLPGWSGPPFISPDGRFIVIATFQTGFPRGWADYANQFIQHILRNVKNYSGRAPFRSFHLIDAPREKMRVLLDAPALASNEVLWSADSRSVILGHVYLPLSGVDDIERNARRSGTFVAEVRILDGFVSRISSEDLQPVQWRDAGRSLVLEKGAASSGDQPDASVTYRKVGTQWRRSRDVVQTSPRMFLKEGMNEPPRFFIANATTGREDLLWDPNPQFAQLQFARVKQLEFSGANGRMLRGGLYYPLDYQTGVRYPLVLQTHGWTNSEFWIDGLTTSGYAAQALAGKNIMVLQLDDSSGERNTVSEVNSEVSNYLLAINDLVDRGLVDVHRVGIHGFSSTCSFVKRALVKHSRRFAAASVIDGIDDGYFQYIIYSNQSAINTIYEGRNGGIPFGKAADNWLDRSTSFGIERVLTPLRIIAPHRFGLLFEWEWYAALTRLDKPVEMIAIRNGVHVLQKPWDRMIAQEGNVDWFRFWLKGEEDPNPSKIEQYHRWHQKRDTQCERLKGADAPWYCKPGALEETATRH